ncbi:MAG: helix-turn-helix-domain containing protein AraC type [Mucilaginibacter sp.]|jgi:AraC-like DNA-binding protein|nr:helix-turn-helix-domain containing protein AraC type [Mucilaginibacter sp.]
MLSEFYTSKSHDQSYIVRYSDYYHALNDYHLHPEIELIYVAKGQGIFVIGEEMLQITGGEFIVIGQNIPHMFKFDKVKYLFPLQKQGQLDLQIQLLTLHFDPGTFGDMFMNMPENITMKDFFKRADKGLLVDRCKTQAIELLKRLEKCYTHERIMLLIKLFNHLAISDNKTCILKTTNKPNFTKNDEKRLSKVYIFTLNNFSRRIKLKEVADMIYMVPHAFCHYFKQKVNKTYFAFLMEVRINHACKLLREEGESIVTVCYESGFTNLSNFNRHFKELTGQTPHQYRKKPE